MNDLASDFTSGFWPIWIAGIALAGIAGCLVLLYVTSRIKVKTDQYDGKTDDGNTHKSKAHNPAEVDIAAVGTVAVGTTGHVWDGDLREMNNPLPRWWVGLFVITIVFGVAYGVLYPAFGSYAGQLGWSSAQQHQQEAAELKQHADQVYAQFKGLSPEQLQKNPEAIAMGERLFLNNCAQCHGSDARGSTGFPNLTDRDWLHGGALETIQTTITDGRIGVMPPMAEAVGSPEDVKNVAHYVLSLSGSPHEAQRAIAGQAKFMVCAACHGVDGKGNQAIGAPNLTDKIWLHGRGEKAIVTMIEHGKTNQMPAQASKLSPEQIKILANYVMTLAE
jgi:cytochrome c oxidase cbb3-type subunit 3